MYYAYKKKRKIKFMVRYFLTAWFPLTADRFSFSSRPPSDRISSTLYKDRWCYASSWLQNKKFSTLACNQASLLAIWPQNSSVECGNIAVFRPSRFSDHKTIQISKNPSLTFSSSLKFFTLYHPQLFSIKIFNHNTQFVEASRTQYACSEYNLPESQLTIIIFKASR